MALVEAAKRLGIKNYAATGLSSPTTTHTVRTGSSPRAWRSSQRAVTKVIVLWVLSADHFRDYKVGAAETAKIATALTSNNKTGTCVMSEEAWDCNKLRELSRRRRV